MAVVHGFEVPRVRPGDCSIACLGFKFLGSNAKDLIFSDYIKIKVYLVCRLHK